MILLAIAVALAAFRYATGDLPSAFTTDFPSDLEVYLLGGRKVAEHLPLYGDDLLPGLPFTYPPFAAVVFSWFHESEALGVAWKIASVAVLAGVVAASSETKRGVALLTAFFVLCTGPVQGTLYFGQINLFLMGLVCLDFLPKNRLPGIGTGLAAGLKLTPAFFVVLLIQQRRWGAVFVAAFTFVCTVATGMEVTDAGEFWTHDIFQTARVGTDDNPGAQSIRQLLARAGVDDPRVWLALSLAVTVLALFASRRAPAPLAASFIGMAACMVSPFSWFHHWVWIVPWGVFVFEEYGALVFLLLMLPFVSVNVSDGLFEVPQLLFMLVPVCFMAVYALRSGYAHSNHRRGDRDSHRPHPRPIRRS